MRGILKNIDTKWYVIFGKVASPVELVDYNQLNFFSQGRECDFELNETRSKAIVRSVYICCETTEEEVLKRLDLLKKTQEEIGTLRKKLYYIQNGYVGNAILWWAKNEEGYTTDITEAHKFTHERMLRQLREKRDGEKAWSCDYIDSTKEAHKLVIDSQYLNPRKQISL